MAKGRGGGGGNYRKINLKKKNFTAGKGNGKNFFKKKKKNQTKGKTNCCYLCGDEGHSAKDCNNSGALRKDAFDLDKIDDDDILHLVVDDLPQTSS